MADKAITCGNCGQTFTLGSGEQEFYQQRGLSEPKRCGTCRGQGKASRDSGGSAKVSSNRVERAKQQLDELFKPSKVKK
jgi:hypothetical protein